MERGTTREVLPHVDVDAGLPSAFIFLIIITSLASLPLIAALDASCLFLLLFLLLLTVEDPLMLDAVAVAVHVDDAVVVVMEARAAAAISGSRTHAVRRLLTAGHRGSSDSRTRKQDGIREGKGHQQTL